MDEPYQARKEETSEPYAVCVNSILSQVVFGRLSWQVFSSIPVLHPDGFEETDSGWPRALKQFAAEAWRRADAGELEDDELYACNAQWSGLYDRMFPHTTVEIERRLALAADYGHSLDA